MLGLVYMPLFVWILQTLAGWKTTLRRVPNHASPLDKALKNWSTSFGTPVQDLFAIEKLQGACVATGQQGMTEWYDTLKGVMGDPLSSHIYRWDAGWTHWIFFSRSQSHNHHTECKILCWFSAQYVLSSLHARTCWHFAPPHRKVYVDWKLAHRGHVALASLPSR